jgi:hypothetical protein
MASKNASMCVFSYIPNTVSIGESAAPDFSKITYLELVIRINYDILYNELLHILRTQRYLKVDQGRTGIMQDPMAIAKDFIDAWNAHDAARAKRHMADDGAIYVIPAFPGTPPEFHGREQIDMFIDGFIQGFRGDFSKLAADGNKVTMFGRLTADGVKAAGIDEVTQNDEAIIVNGRIQTFTIRFTPETIKQIDAVNAKQ